MKKNNFPSGINKVPFFFFYFDKGWKDFKKCYLTLKCVYSVCKSLGPLTQVPFFSPEQQRTGVLDKQRGPTYTHSCPCPRTHWRSMEGNKDRWTKCYFLLTKTVANLSSSSPGSGMGSFRGMLCPLWSVCWSMLPALPMVGPTSTTFLFFFF